jgi:hypothetical protein
MDGPRLAHVICYSSRILLGISSSDCRFSEYVIAVGLGVYHTYSPFFLCVFIFVHMSLFVAARMTCCRDGSCSCIYSFCGCFCIACVQARIKVNRIVVVVFICHTHIFLRKWKHSQTVANIICSICFYIL